MAVRSRLLVFLVEEGLRESDPVGRGRYTPGRKFGSHERGLVPRLVKLPWIPGEQQGLDALDVVREEPVRNRVMLALAYDATLRREELCSLRTEDVDPAHRTPRSRAETTKTRRERVERRAGAAARRSRPAPSTPTRRSTRGVSAWSGGRRRLPEQGFSDTH
ncbi:hypothetical protein SUDANB180_05694 [Streptomyces sp. enrichment culture]